MIKSSSISSELTESRSWWKAAVKRFVNGLVRAARTYSRRRRYLLPLPGGRMVVRIDRKGGNRCSVPFGTELFYFSKKELLFMYLSGFRW